MITNWVSLNSIKLAFESRLIASAHIMRDYPSSAKLSEDISIAFTNSSHVLPSSC